jgi:hypothetical protein
MKMHAKWDQRQPKHAENEYTWNFSAVVLISAVILTASARVWGTTLEAYLGSIGSFSRHLSSFHLSSFNPTSSFSRHLSIAFQSNPMG